jgi:5-methylcytosine-specific restriction endonuclease McrA
MKNYLNRDDKMKTSKADKYFSLYIRLRDVDENGLAKCCTCGKIGDVKYMDCGHFIKRQHMATRFDVYNCATQCKKCNAFEQGRDADFEKYILNRWGEMNLNHLKVQKHITRKYGKFELENLAIYFKQKAEQLAKEKNLKLW